MKRRRSQTNAVDMFVAVAFSQLIGTGSSIRVSGHEVGLLDSF